MSRYSTFVLLFAAAMLLSSCLGADVVKVIKTVNSLNASAIDVMLNTPPRFMWGWGPGLSGYCGETSFQTNGIFWGSWISSEYVRTADGGSELLIAVNDVTAAKNLKMTYESWNYNAKNPQAPNFIAWLRGHINNGHLVAIGVFEKLPSGDEDYDHIVPVVGYQYDSSTGATNGIYINDLYMSTPRFISASAGVTSRKGCSQSSAPSQPYNYCIPSSVDYGIAFTGIQDTKKETYRMTLQMPSWTEPDWGKEDKVNAKPVSFTISASVQGLTVGSDYTILRFDSYSTLPTSGFINGPFTKQFNFTATAATMNFTNFDSFMSNSTIFYRTVAV
jgi:hypothetical protein